MPHAPAKILYSSFKSPLGQCWVAWSDLDICAVSLKRKEEDFLSLKGHSKGMIFQKQARCHPEARRQLLAYFNGKLKRFSLPLDFLWGTNFQQAVWKGLLTIPYGETRSYRWLAEKVGSPRAFRAAGQANGKNPIPIVIPCHRVISADGSLGGFTGGLDLKRRLLAIEGVQLAG